MAGSHGTWEGQQCCQYRLVYLGGGASRRSQFTCNLAANAWDFDQLMPVLYFAGLLLLRRQFKQEAEGRKGLTSASDEDRLTNTNMRASGDAQEPAHLSYTLHHLSGLVFLAHILLWIKYTLFIPLSGCNDIDMACMAQEIGRLRQTALVWYVACLY